MANFVKHEPCPKCRSRNNLGAYDDGSKWCFGCGFYLPPNRTVLNSRKEKEKEALNSDISDIFDDCSSIIPEKPLKWLKSYGITNEEIQLHGIVYSPKRESLRLGIQWRYFGRTELHPKCITFDRTGYSLEVGDNPDTGIFVEDFISAIKVGRTFTGLPIFGAHVEASRLKWASDRFKRVGIWLDSDKASVAARIVHKGRLLMGDRCFRIWTEQDPKCYTTEKIKEFVNERLSYEQRQSS